MQASAKGCEVTSLDGQVYTDFSEENAGAVHGHSCGEICGAVVEAMKSGLHMGGTSPLETDLAGKVGNVLIL